MTETLYLAHDVHVCVTEGCGVFLDLKRDKYSAVMFPRDAPASLAAKLALKKEDLLKAGLMTTDAGAGRPIEEAPIESIDGHIFGPDDHRAFGLAREQAAGLKISFGETWDFFVASWKASRDLKTRHISEVVSRVRDRKAFRESAPADIEKVRRLTAVYRRLRPWYPRKYLCLYDSLALVEFMARRAVFPTWVFAVQAQPFGAHCWVQNERLLLNEGAEFAGQYTPIMAV